MIDALYPTHKSAGASIPMMLFGPRFINKSTQISTHYGSKGCNFFKKNHTKHHFNIVPLFTQVREIVWERYYGSAKHYVLNTQKFTVFYICERLNCIYKLFFFVIKVHTLLKIHLLFLSTLCFYQPKLQVGPSL